MAVHTVRLPVRFFYLNWWHLINGILYRCLYCSIWPLNYITYNPLVATKITVAVVLCERALRDRQTTTSRSPTHKHTESNILCHSLSTTDWSGTRSWYFLVCPSLSGCSFSLCTVADVYLRFSVDPYLYYVMALNQRNNSSLYGCLLLCSTDLYSPFKVLVQYCL